MPVVENLRDMWKVTKLQQERKAKQEKEQALQELEELKRGSDPLEVRNGPSGIFLRRVFRHARG